MVRILELNDGLADLHGRKTFYFNECLVADLHVMKFHRRYADLRVAYLKTLILKRRNLYRSFVRGAGISDLADRQSSGVPGRFVAERPSSYLHGRFIAKSSSDLCAQLVPSVAFEAKSARFGSSLASMYLGALHWSASHASSGFLRPTARNPS